MNDQELYQKLIQKDQKALAYLFEKEALGLYNFACRISSQRELSQDLVQDLFVDLFKLIHNYKFHSSLRSWLFGVLKRRCLDHFKKQKLRMGLLERFFSAPSQTTIEDPCTTLLKPLDPESRALLWLKEVEGFTLKEIAAAWKVPEGTLKSKVHRAKEKIKLAEKEIEHAL